MKILEDTGFCTSCRNMVEYSYGDGWHDWYSQYMGEISLKNGVNKILVTTTGLSETTNFDYIDLYAAKALS